MLNEDLSRSVFTTDDAACCKRMLNKILNISMSNINVEDNSSGIARASNPLNYSYNNTINTDGVDYTDIVSTNLIQRISICCDLNETKPAGFLTSNERLLVAVILGTTLIVLILSTLRIMLKVYSRYYENHHEDIEAETS